MAGILQMLEHRFANKRLSAYVDGQLSERDRTRVEAHLRVCAECRSEVRTLSWTKSLLREAPRVPLPRSFLIREADVASRPSATWVMPALRWATALVAVIFVAVLVGDVLTARWTYFAQRPPALVSRKEEAKLVSETVVVERIEAAPTPTPEVRAAPTSANDKVAAVPSPTPEAKVMAVPSPTPQVRAKTATTPEAEAGKESGRPPTDTARALAADNVTPLPTATPSPPSAPPGFAATPPPLPTATPCYLVKGGREPVPPCAVAATPEPGPLPVFATSRTGWRVAEVALGLTLIALVVILVWARARR